MKEISNVKVNKNTNTREIKIQEVNIYKLWDSNLKIQKK